MADQKHFFFVKTQEYLVYSPFCIILSLFSVLFSQTVTLDIINRLLSFYFLFQRFRFHDIVISCFPCNFIKHVRMIDVAFRCFSSLISYVHVRDFFYRNLTSWQFLLQGALIHFINHRNVDIIFVQVQLWMFEPMGFMNPW